MRAAVAILRILHALAHALGGLGTIVFAFPRLTEPQRQDRVQSWAARMLQVLGITLEVHGRPVDHGPCLLVANHVSWLDILVLHAARHCRFVSKSEVRQWPLIGRLATGAGTLYIERDSRRDALRVVHHMADALRSGEILAVFPEGRTSDGSQVLPFHGNLLQAAIAAESAVQPVALDFIDRRTRARSSRPSYTDDATLVGSLWRTLTGPAVIAWVSFGEPQAAQGRDRRGWAVHLREEVERLRS